MKKAVFCFLLFAVSTQYFGDCNAVELPADTQKAIRRLHDKFIENSESRKRFLAFGSMGIVNLERQSPDEPDRTLSEFVLMSDPTRNFRRHSCAKESLDAGKLIPLGWYTRMQENGQIKGGFEKSGPPQEVQVVYRLVLDNDPWHLAVASTSHIMNEQAVAGFFERVCDASKAIDYRQLNGETTVLYQYNETCRLQVLYSSKYGGMPVQALWLVARSTIHPKYEPDDYFVHCQISSRWAEYAGTWLPHRIGVECFQPTANRRQLLLHDWTFEYHWVAEKAIDIDQLRYLPSVDLLEYSRTHELKPNSRQRVR